ncbi:hypothetical protein DAPPUDRAFT_318602 [Daphnia pulex]|uniref:Uncharacterized protein n=1 Tax=Daphnia pulex TaxID=6669 RepID=E9GJA9_DAPPU|nr:hypothetical protein DAPPUDRAFT_318602 [Daphnia pulex]|eukprot:EFX80416.1 hypothetical protein DAPPUDRAFT_318602 [Daphnia pulex]
MAINHRFHHVFRYSPSSIFSAVIVTQGYLSEVKPFGAVDGRKSVTTHHEVTIGTHCQIELCNKLLQQTPQDLLAVPVVHSYVTLECLKLNLEFNLQTGRPVCMSFTLEGHGDHSVKLSCGGVEVGNVNLQKERPVCMSFILEGQGDHYLKRAMQWGRGWTHPLQKEKIVSFTFEGHGDHYVKCVMWCRGWVRTGRIASLSRSCLVKHGVVDGWVDHCTDVSWVWRIPNRNANALLLNNNIGNNRYYITKAPGYYPEAPVTTPTPVTFSTKTGEYYTEAPKYYSAPIYTAKTETVEHYAAPTYYTEASPSHYVEQKCYTDSPVYYTPNGIFVQIYVPILEATTSVALHTDISWSLDEILFHGWRNKGVHGSHCVWTLHRNLLKEEMSS